VLESPSFFLARHKLHVLMLEIERWFLYFPSVVSKSLKSYHAKSDDYCTLEASPTFRQKKFSLFCSASGFRMLDDIDHVVHKS
jgi:hypothetical protein